MEQRIALVTGANRGIGLEVCRQLVRLGIRVVLTARREDKGRAAVEELAAEGLNVSFLPLDVTSEKDRLRILEDITREFGRLDILINNAGISIDFNVPALEVSFDEVIRPTIETNLYGPLHLTQLFVPLMRKHDYGRIVNVSSGLGSFSKITSGRIAYRLSKVGLNAMTKVFADELKDTNILVNVMTPGWVRTNLGGVKAERSTEQGADTIIWLATLPDDGPRGRFFRDRQDFPW
ncbi:SDR family oxidoreductase [Stigmatella aurantiaca]|uniref:Carbonyl reductase [NADPH] 1 (Nadph-dependent carbonylreductase 1) (Prostaglandin-e(2) 9-reductase) n=1 Tax=Stigmatella aurantiaca (strain DW4/3-1) TaxID=378806 RepID=Q09E76_STIAD|nr:SDR family oxidoreductase [Stigmatella aurantiaca]ADO74712.1 Short-chain dehydrogenase/reductase SDR [Stigmatella aurantiaca DW4/3-1]EAU70052.1 carbonyl reductase [NADPH] 1 (nadph-dependent carbonylreductase 1) (prostaglandin-e(2) 9-reductase) [Stigmatella aurantiaca DW4/3-1]